MNIVVDTNIFISAIIKEGTTRKIIIETKHNFLFPEFEFIEIKNHLDEILNKSGMNFIEFSRLFKTLLKHVQIVKNEEIIHHKEESLKIIGSIDINDAPFIATALATNSLIRSDDKHFKKQNRVKILTTKDIINLIK